ncbi:antibiotic biosynthesis monooxygenase family protein [Kitasatospora aureofaciens]|uniref:antibiotic biosynthesis monooxygenase family protein n=1 Tax=Kitasatospora aureofaciens TaxID=1894 RepID=UPI001C48B0B5|nr:antibiotic biosynthesis monooxygenase family protein [Kitasatospora aureofaciens]MBV6695853.1 antibiotic biosynthesis monooxygenase [Kitasatospora aureofaciens]
MFTFINRFTVTGDVAEFEALVGEITDFMSTQSGFRSHRFYRSAADATVYVETAEWDDAASHKAATGSPEFRSRVGKVMGLAQAEPAPFDLIAQHGA